MMSVQGLTVERPFGAPGADVVHLLHMPIPCLPADVAIGDLDDLLNAVRAKLRLTVADRLAQIPELLTLDAAFAVQTSVLECVAALDQLHLTLSHELARRHELEIELAAAHAALAQAHAVVAPPGPDAAGGERRRVIRASLPRRSAEREHWLAAAAAAAAAESET